MTNLILYSGAVILGLCLGSFANVLVLRDKERASIITGRSRCMHCGYELRWYDLIPVISFLVLRARCRRCQAAISWQYPIVELVSGGLACLVLWFSLEQGVPLLGGLGFFLALWWLLIVSIIDIRTLEVPVEYVVVAGVLGFFSAWYGLNATWPYLGLGILVGAGSLATVLLVWKVITKQDGMGEGDLWIAGAVGALVGFPAIIVALFTAIFAGAFVGLGLLAFQGKKLQTALPFGPFLFLGAIIALIWGQKLVQWYILTLWI